MKKVEFSWGATEVKARVPGVSAIVDITETGTSLQANKLRIIDTIMHTTARLIANRDSWADPEKRCKIEDIALLLKGAIAGRRRVGLKMNAPRENIDQVRSLRSLPCRLVHLFRSVPLCLRRSRRRSHLCSIRILLQSRSWSTKRQRERSSLNVNVKARAKF